MISVGECRICRAGQLGLRLCGKCRAVVILCNECDAAWYQCKLKDKPTYADEESMPCPACGSNLWNEESSWANLDEASKSDWLKNLNIEIDDPETNGLAD